MGSDVLAEQSTDNNESKSAANYSRGGRASLQTFLIVVVFLSIAAPAVITGGFLIYENYERTIEHESRAAAGNYADLLQAGMTMPLWNVAPSLGEPLLDTVRIDPSVLRIIVQGIDDETFLKYENEEPILADESLSIVREITFEGEKLGSVSLAYSLKAARQRAAADSQLLFTIIIFQLIFSLGVLSYFLRLRVVRPLVLLARAAVGIAGGDLKTAIPTMNKDEFGRLSGQLEIMRGSLEQSFTTLEDRVKERTTELVDLNKELKGTLDKLQQAQGNLVQSEKLAALGALVAGVAHELNTPLGNGLTVASSLFDATRHIQRQFKEGITRSDLENYLADMQEGSHLVVASLERASELVSGFKQVAVDRTSAQQRQFKLAEVLAETKMTMSPLFKHTPYKINIKVSGDVMMDSYPGPLGQVITNLMNNALIHAFSGCDHGTIDITCELTTVAGQEGVCMVIQDDGHGIREENLKKIFDPFFTTKLGEGGNGLGMHIVHNIVTGVLGGAIEVESKLDKGTCFTIAIPLDAPVSRVGTYELEQGEAVHGE
ncbi:sensor histidine kinase [Teredinibacter haidensis]|uniref:sensor histidine kinase n=1 Tax=Teredinibacter haidensis TaxID=2731755 RepID=UPI00163BE5F3|nr:HAMP domain-containing sensor histidine kinase [Teredinibacter haidensis]